MRSCVVVLLASMISAGSAFFSARKCAQAMLRPGTAALLVSRGNTQQRMMASASRPPNANRESLSGERAGWKKRKVALVMGYVGTGYYGLQFNPTSAHLKTIEGEVEDALFRAGHIAESNYRSLAKIGWSRSSRTDKGVHAARIVLNAKLLFNPDWITTSNHVPALVERINTHLPENIRAFSCFRSQNSFVAKELCNMREYEYLLPVDMILGHTRALSPDEKQDIIAKLNKILEKFEGTHSFHNFTRLKLRDIVDRRDRRAAASTAACEPEDAIESDDADTNEVSEVDESEEADGSPAADTSQQQASQRQDREKPPVFEGWEPVRHAIAGQQKVTCTLYGCAAKEWVQLDGRDFVKIRLRGQAFLLNQIRMMVGAAVLYAQGILPEIAVDTALRTHLQVRMPVAPAEGLVLVDAEFGRSRTPLQLRDPDGIDQTAPAMMRQIDDASAIQFLNQRIIPEIARMWTPELIQAANDFHQRFVPPPELTEQWHTYLEAADQQARDARQTQLERDLKRIQVALVALRAEGHPRPDEGIDMDIYRLILPAGFSTAVAREFELRPSLVVADIQRAVAVQLLEGKLAPTADADVLLEHVRVQGFQQLAAIGHDYRSYRPSR